MQNNLLLFLLLVLFFVFFFLLFVLYKRNNELFEQNAHLKSILHGSVRACFVVDDDDFIVYLNLAMLQILGEKEQNILHKIWYEKIVPNEEKSKFKNLIYKQDDNDLFIHIIEADQKARPYLLNYTKIGTYILFELQDLSCYEEHQAKFEELANELEHLKKSLREQETNFKKTFDMAVNGIAILTGDGEATYTNKSLQTMLDYNEDYLKQLGLQPLFSDSESFPTLLKTVKNEHNIQRLPHHFRNRSGVSMDVSISMSYLAELDQYLVIIQDVTKELEYTKKLEKQKESYARRADMDVLTPCFSRSYLDILLKNMCEAKKEFTYIMFDVDHFKSVNDTYGHLIGDEVLIKVVKTVKEGLRATDTLARYGGEEFAIVLERTSKADALQLAEKLRKMIEETSFPPVENLTCSFGVSCDNSPLTCKQIIECADIALYQAKTNGRNRVEMYKSRSSI
ncbi:diguanylate cyclase [Sulfurimonas sp. HSL-1716]|uniref:diguanylate cyclase n=1 Tax=Hydrocurvibacter sulfurireducens TaxID=3131937 RepID=UPI0031F8A474